MRILAIRGRNLASLEGDFEVDFRVAPLADAGVFAISGPTGAGKSTLLDAMCLALYHDTPRLRSAKEAQVSVPDIKDQTLSPQDPRNLLRRGSAEGFAEVEFEDQHGVVWRARWSVSRAHGKIGKRLQAATVQLSRADQDGSMGGTVQELREQLRQLTGLSFEQFCRSVLLAQNDFAALLKARQEERAGLLEALTGSEIFSQISMLAHQRNASERQQLKDLEQRLQLQAPMPQSERELLQQRSDELRTHSEQHGATITQLQTELQWHAHGADLSERLAATQTQQQQAQTAVDADAPTGQQIRRWVAAQALQTLVELLGQSARQVQQRQASQPGIARALAEVELQLQTLNPLCATAAAGLTAAQAAREQALPQLAAARAADTQIQIASNALQQQAAAAARSLQSEQRLQAQIEALQTEQQVLNVQLDRHRAWQRAHPALGGDDARWQELGQCLQSLLGTSERRASAELRHAQWQQSISEADDELGQLQSRLQQADLQLQQANEHLRLTELERDALDAQALERRRDLWVQQDRAVTALQVLLQGWQEIERRRQTASQRCAELQQQLDGARGALTLALAALQSAGDADRDASNALQRVQLVADAHTEQLRELLVEGEPCPVCGAREHPDAGQRSPQLSAVLTVLQQQAETAQLAHRRAIADHQAGKSNVSAIELWLAEAGQILSRETDAQSSARQTLQSAASALFPAAITIVELAERLPELRQQLVVEGAAIEQLQVQVRAANQRFEASRKAQQAALSSYEQQQSAQAQLRAKLTPQREALLAVAGEMSAIDADLDAATAQLRTWPGLSDGRRDQVPALREQWRAGDELRRQAELAARELLSLGARQETLTQQLIVAAEARQAAEQAHALTRTALDEAVSTRHSLLAQDDTEAYARALELAVADARSELEQAQARQRSAEQQLREIREQQTLNQQQLLEAQQQSAELVAQIQRQWAPQCADLGLEAANLDALHELLRSLPADLSERQQAWQSRLQALHALADRIDALQAEIRLWQAQALSTRERASIEVDLVQAKAQRDLSLQQLGALDDQLAQDQRRRTAAAQQSAVLRERQQQAQRWAVLDKLIGAADGSKFKRYAQQFTLEVLLEYANQHLQRLSPRYRLRRGMEALSLLIIDSDLGDEVRTVHSLSGGETFLVSLALALGLASLSSQRVRVESLFIDEGFGSLDTDTLNTAMEALDRLQAEGRRVGVISHVPEMAERIGVQIHIEAIAPGRSRVRVAADSDTD
jgi:DNA repair protein SbcC/Rad50